MAPSMSGPLVRLEALSLDHAQGYAAALGGDPAIADEVFAWLRIAPPRTVEQARDQIAAALDQRDQRLRLPFAQVDTATGAVIGTTSFYEIDPDARSLAIGHTWLGRAWQRTGHNTDAKLMMMARAFDELGAVRVVWHTDINNARSRAAIARLGASQEGIMRKHKPRRDGSWRDTVLFSMLDDEWPAARQALTRARDARLAEPAGMRATGERGGGR
ncbi:MAG: GCN5-like N-acetyltransferase [Modestobacter sp.]|nr:GCN5-like N-acetyltransferase [Modestobacter sp.]